MLDFRMFLRYLVYEMKSKLFLRIFLFGFILINFNNFNDSDVIIYERTLNERMNVNECLALDKSFVVTRENC